MVEGNDINRRVAMLMLEKVGCRADAVNNGQDAIADTVKETPYDVILMDCQMPIMDGFEATRQIRRWEATRTGVRNIRIIAMTANAFREGARPLAPVAGMNNYLSKPMRIESLHAALQEVSDSLAKTSST